MKILFDIWGGEGHMDHVARSLLDTPNGLIDSALAQQIATELRAGFLVNLRAVNPAEGVPWGPESNFDERSNAVRPT